MASPFNVFRRNQRIMMAVLTGLAMFAFVFFDVTTTRSGPMSKSLTVILVAGICALGLWFVGSRRGKGGEWALWGAVIGAVAAFLFVRSAASEPAIRGKGFEITELQLQKLGQKRYQVNRFVFEAGRRSKASRPAQGFGATDERSMIQFVLGRQEVKRLGISLTDDAVNRYIRDITDDKLSIRDFHEILRELTLSEGDLFNQLREELEVRLALGVQMPPSDSWLNFDPQSRQFFFQPKLVATPDEEWRIFRRLNLKQSLSVVPIPVSAFLNKVEEPAEAELLAFFELHKDRPPGPQGEPGFLQPHRVQLAYLAADFEKFESLATPPTDEEIAAYYEANKDLRYRIRGIPDQPLSEPEPADATQSENMAPPLPAPSDDATQPTEEASPQEEQSSRERIPTRLVSLIQETDEPAGDAKPEEGEKSSDTPKGDSDTPKGDKESAPVEDPFPIDLPSPARPNEKEPVRYRQLDDELREEIREEMLRDRAFEKMGEARDKAWQYMNQLASAYQEADEQKRTTLAASLAEDLKKYAVDHALNYVETELMSETELQSSAKEPIGSAVLATESPLSFQMTSVAEDLFPRNGQMTPLYTPQRADSRLRSQRYVYWKIRDVPQHVPDWKDAGVKEQVLTAWKFENGRTLARQRAEALLELARQQPQDLASALSGQTVTGEPGSEALVIKETPRFSWMTTSSTTPFDFGMAGLMPPRLSFVDGVDQPGEDFMKTVFEELKVGDLGIVQNTPRSVVYLVQVRERDASEPMPENVEGYQTLDDLRGKFLAEQGSDRTGFSNRPYNLVMSNTYYQLQQEWFRAFDRRYGVELEELQAIRQARSRRR